LLRVGRRSDAIDCFEQALGLHPEHAQSHIGLALALRSTGSIARADSTARALQKVQARLAGTRAIEAALVESQAQATGGHVETACAVLCSLLDTAPPGFAGWTIPIEPLLFQLHGSKEFLAVLRRLADRAQ
jgi:hypothetical protein